MPHRLLPLLQYSTYPTSAAMIQTYAANVHRPLQDILTPLRLAHYAYLLGGAIRIYLNYVFREAYDRYDLPLAVFTRLTTSHSSSLVVLLLILLVIVFDYVLLLRPHPKVAPMLLDLVVHNRGSVKWEERMFFKCFFKQTKNVFAFFCLTITAADLGCSHSSQLSSNSGALKHFNVAILQKLINLWQSILHNSILVSSSQSSTCPLVYFRSFSRATRNQIALLDYYTENFLILFVPFLNYGISAIIIHYIVIAVWPLYRDVLLIQIIQYFADYFIVLALTFYTFKKFILFYKLLPLVCYAWLLHGREITRRAFRVPMKMVAVAVVEDKNKRNLFRHKLHPNKNKHSITSVSIRTTHFMREHTKLLVDLVHFNQHFASVLIFWYYFSIFFISVSILCLLYFLPVPFFVKVYYNGVFVLTIGSFALLLFLSPVIKVLYSGGAGELYRVQMNCVKCGVGGGILQFKLKLMSYYEVLRTKKKVTFTFGHHARINNKWLLEVKNAKMQNYVKFFLLFSFSFSIAHLSCFLLNLLLNTN